MRRLAPTFLRPMSARLCVVHVIVIQDRVQTHDFCPKSSEGEASTSHGKDNRSSSIFSLGNLWPSLGLLNKSLETFALCFALFLLVCVFDGAVCLMYVEATRFPIQRRREAVVARPSSFRESQDIPKRL